MTTRSVRWPAAAIALLALASSATSIVNQFTYDDRYVIQENPVMRTLAHWWRTFANPYWPRMWGGDGYRPLTILSFNVQYVIGGGRPVVFHAVNILLYAAVAVLVLLLARRLLPSWAAFIAAACFAVHPVHVEAVANVVGQSELLVALAIVPAVLLYLRDRMAGPLRPRTAAAITALYAVACFSKEHGIVLPGILLAAEFTLVDEETPWRERVRRDRPFYLVLILVAVCMLWAHSYVLRDHSLGGFQPFTPFSSLAITNRDRVLTAVSVVPEWVRLFYWPVHLSSEYGPADIRIAQGFGIEQLPGFLLLLSILTLGIALRRRQPLVSFGIAFVVVALLPSSNFILPAGILLAERTMFLASVGAMLVLGAVIVPVFEWLKRRVTTPRLAHRVGVAMCAIVLAAGMGRSMQRSTVWHDNDRLFRQAVIDSPDSYRAHFMLGAWDFDHKRKGEGEAEYKKAMALFPYDPFVAYALAEQYLKMGWCKAAIPFYRWAEGFPQRSGLGRSALALCLMDVANYSDARKTALEAIRYGGDIKMMRRVIIYADSVMRTDSAGKGMGPVTLAGRSGKVPGSVQKARLGTPHPPGG